MIQGLRWGMSAYETEEDLAREVGVLETLGVSLSRSVAERPDFRDVEILVVNSGVCVDRQVLDSARSLRLIVTTTSGSDHIDVESAKARGVAVGRCPMARRDAVVDTSMAMGLALLRRIPVLQHSAQEGRWVRDALPVLAPTRVREMKVGLVGVGVIGTQAMLRWKALGAEVRFHDPSRTGSVHCDELCEWSDLLSLHCSLSESSRHLLNSDRIRLLRPGAIVVNTARGDCIDLEALFQARHLGGIGLDVFAEEPPQELGDWASRDNVLLTPHAAGFHPNMAKEVCSEVAEAVSAFLAGEPLPASL